MDVPQTSSRSAVSTTKRAKPRSPGNNSDTKSPLSSKPTSNTTIPFMALSTPYLKEHQDRDQITEQPFESALLGP